MKSRSSNISKWVEKDYSKVVHATPLVAYLLRPVSTEIQGIRNMSIQLRRERMRKLIEDENLLYQRDLVQLNKSHLKSISTGNCCNRRDDNLRFTKY